MTLQTVIPTANGGSRHDVRAFVEQFRDTPFIYGLVDPLEPQHVRYVGLATRAKRPFEHFSEAREAHGSTRRHIYHWVRKLRREGRSYNVIVLEVLSEDCSWELLGFVEECYIESLRDLGHNLTNTAPGGAGNRTGNPYPRSFETKRKLRAVSYWNGPERESRIEAARARWTSEVREEQARKLRGKHHTDEHNERCRIAQGLPEVRAAKSATAQRCKCSKCGRFAEAPHTCVELAPRISPSEEIRAKISKTLRQTRAAECQAKGDILGYLHWKSHA